MQLQRWLFAFILSLNADLIAVRGMAVIAIFQGKFVRNYRFNPHTEVCTIIIVAIVVVDESENPLPHQILPAVLRLYASMKRRLLQNEPVEQWNTGQS